MSEERSVSRRGFIRAATGATAAVGASATAAAQEDGGASQGGSATVTLVDFAFEPGTEEPLYITPGTTVTFVWETSTHNIVVDSQPAEADWGGHQPIENAGFEIAHTFETLGEYTFHCQPHVSQGMEGTIVVNEQGAPPESGGGEPAIPPAATNLGVFATAAMALTLGFAFVLLKYGGGGGQSAE